ncbi:MAG: hypothetical protein GYA14_14100 [Ignavibacteria bacterium]|nr:hypothetical protein [Ignavibacteria bacterium]
MAKKYQTVKQTAGKADSVIGDFFNAYIQVNRGDIATTTEINTDADGYTTSISVTGDIEYTITYTYDAQKRISQVDYAYKEYIFKEHLSADATYKIYSSRFPVWDSNYTATIYKNGTQITSGFTINYNSGNVTFTDAQQSSDDIQVSFRHTINVRDTYTYSTNKITIVRQVL